MLDDLIMKFTLSLKDAMRLNGHPCWCNGDGGLWQFLKDVLRWNYGKAYITVEQALSLIGFEESKIIFQYKK